MRNEPRVSAPLDEAIDAVLCDMMAKEAPVMLKSRVLARLGDEAIDATLRDLATREVPPTLKARVLTRLDQESTGSDRAHGERRTLVQPFLRPAFGLAAAALVAATALTAWLLRAPLVPAPGGERAGQVASQLDGSGGKSAPGMRPPGQSKGAVSDREPLPGGATTSAVVTRASRLVRPPGATRLARHTTTRSGAQSEDVAGDQDDPFAIRQLKVEPLSISTIAIPPIEVAPVEIVPPMSDTAPGPPGESRSESRTGDQG